MHESRPVRGGVRGDFLSRGSQDVTAAHHNPPADTLIPGAPCASLAGFAAGLAANDLPVFPLLPRTKRPRFPGGFKTATTDALRVDQHWYHYPDDNIGLRPPPGVVVLDVDPRNGGDKSMANLVAEHGRLPETWVARTGSGGWHYFFTVGQQDVRSHLAPGVDVKHGATGYIVAPPSVHPNGLCYRWLRPPFGEPAAGPAWLLAMLKPVVYAMPNLDGNAASNGGTYTLQCLVSRINSAPKGDRNCVFYGACRDAAKQGTLGIWEDTLLGTGIACGLTPGEVEATLRSAGRCGS